MKNILYRKVQSNGHTVEFEKVDESVIVTAFVATEEGVQADIELDLEELTELINYLDNAKRSIVESEQIKSEKI